MKQQGGVLDIEVDFRAGGNLANFSSVGFSKQEVFGTWTLGTESSLILSREGDPEPAVLSVTVRPCVVPEARTEQRLVIMVNGVHVFGGAVKATSTISVELPGVVFSGSRDVVLSFLHPDAIVPEEFGISKDARRLAIQFDHLLLHFLRNTKKYSVNEKENVGQSVTKSQKPSAVCEDEVHVGKNGWLFLVGGTNDVLRYYNDFEYFTEKQACKWADLLISRREKLDKKRIQYLHIVAPDKISIYPEMFGEELPNLERSPAKLLKKELNARGHSEIFIDPSEIFLRYPEKYDLYLKTDSHWSYLAGTLVLAMVSGRLGQPRHPSLARRAKNIYRYTWDLGRKVSPPVSEEYYYIETLPTVTRFYANELALCFEEAMKHGRPVTHGSINVAFRNTDPLAIQKTLVIFGDSFMDFQYSNATTIFAENFREVYFVWSPQIDYDYVDMVKADVVVTEIAERFMISVPGDAYNLAQESARALRFYEVQQK